MKPIIFIVSTVAIAFPLCSVLSCPHTGGYTNQDKRPPVIDEIFQACGPLFFQPGSSEISDEDKDCLLEISLMLQHASNSNYHVVIDGHRDSSEVKDVSLIRAKNTRDYLVNHKNVNPARVIVRDYGETCPNESKDKKLNGRVEFRYWRKDRKIKSMPNWCAPGAKPNFKIMKIKSRV